MGVEGVLGANGEDPLIPLFYFVIDIKKAIKKVQIFFAGCKTKGRQNISLFGLSAENDEVTCQTPSKFNLDCKSKIPLFIAIVKERCF